VSELNEHIRSFFEKHPEHRPEEPGLVRFGLETKGDVVREVNLRIDQFAHYPREATLVGHRKFLHHREGCEYFGLQYGRLGEQAAIQHVIDDMGAVHKAIAFYDGTLDGFGGVRR
jgi:hypothetical protein